MLRFATARSSRCTRHSLRYKKTFNEARNRVSKRTQRFVSAFKEVEPPIVPEQVNSHVKGLDEYKTLYNHSIEAPDEFWDKAAKDHLFWHRPYDRVSSGDFKSANVAWFLNGELNVSENCVDRHLDERGDQTAIIWEGDKPGQSRRVTYKELHIMVCELGNVLKRLGVRKGDAVCIYMPMVPEAAAAMLACARIGAIHTVVFAGFSSDAIRQRINDAGCKVVLTADEGLRGGRFINLKHTVDEALRGCPQVKSVLVYRRTGQNASLQPGRDQWMHEAMDKEPSYCPAEPMNSEDPLFLLYTSGSTGSPKGLVHTTAGYLLYAAMTHKYIFDYRPGDIHACVADIGWITGHSYIVYGPLANGATTVMFESIPTYPDASRYWDLVEKYKVTTFYTAPTAIRALQKFGTDPVKKHDLSSLRVLGTVGEPISPEAWKWYYEVVGNSKCSIVDTYWQTETGGIIISPMAGATPLKPGSAALPFFGVKLGVFDPATGKKVEQGKSGSGLLFVDKPWPAMTRTVLGDHQRYRKTYLSMLEDHYFTGDGCKIDEDGYVWITGRVDDVITRAGHRLGTAEIEGALVEHPGCTEAAVVAIPDDIKGQAIVAFCTMRSGYNVTAETKQELRQEVQTHIGAIAKPDEIILTDVLPKTRSGKIVRRMLVKVAEGKDDIGDATTLSEPETIDQLKKSVKEQRS